MTVAASAARARAAQPAWAATGVRDRCEVLRRMVRWVGEHADDLADVIVAETGKARDDAVIAELGYTLQALAFWARRAPGWLADERVRWAGPALVGRRLSVRHAPLGVVGVIAPWNYPLANALGDVIPALAAGNAVLLKPSEHTPRTALLAAEGLRACGLPDGVLEVVTGAGEAGAAVVDAVDMVMFTGSTATGRAVAERAGRRLIPASLELGGKDPMLVLADADLERAANTAVYYAMQNAGQTCLSIERVLVEDAVHDRFAALVAERVAALRTGRPGGLGAVDVGGLSAPGQIETVEAHVADAVAHGAEVVCGGHRVTGPGDLYAPTVLTGVTPAMRCMREETFGPLLPIMRVADEDEAVAVANDSPYGLAASVFTRSARRGEAVAARLEAGSVAVNDAMVFFAALDLPMGGWKDSGVGSRHGIGGIRKYTRAQSVVAAGRLPRRDVHTYPYRAWRTRLLLSALRRLSAPLPGRPRLAVPGRRSPGR